jgi:hypothetical protein
VKRAELEHALRSASKITGDNVILVIGSQSILGSYWEDELPPEATVSMEVDLGFFNDPDGRKSADIEGFNGIETDFSRTYGFYIDGIDATTATLPHGWHSRLVTLRTASTDPGEGRCLEPHDCAISKLVAGREKDYVFVGSLLRARLIHADLLLERLAATEVPELVRQRMAAWITYHG